MVRVFSIVFFLVSCGGVLSMLAGDAAAGARSESVVTVKQFVCDGFGPAFNTIQKVDIDWGVKRFADSAMDKCLDDVALQDLPPFMRGGLKPETQEALKQRCAAICGGGAVSRLTLATVKVRDFSFQYNFHYVLLMRIDIVGSDDSAWRFITLRREEAGASPVVAKAKEEAVVDFFAQSDWFLIDTVVSF